MAKNKINFWTEEEIQLLQEYLNKGMSYKEISKKINRSTCSIEQKIRKLRNLTYQNSDFKIKGKWSNEEIQLLKKYCEKGYTYKEIANKLNRTVDSVRGRIMQNKTTSFSTPNRGKKWTKEEEKLLLQYHDDEMIAKEISEKLGRSIHSIHLKLMKLLNENYINCMSTYHKNKNNKSKKYANNHRKPWTEEEDLQLKEYLEKGYSREDIAKILGRTFKSIEGRKHIKGY